MPQEYLTHWGRVTHICVGNLTIIGSDNGLSPGRRQSIIRTNAGILLIGPLGTNFSDILIGIQTFSFQKIYLKMSSVKWRPFGLGLNVLSMMLPYIERLETSRGYLERQGKKRIDTVCLTLHGSIKLNPLSVSVNTDWCKSCFYRLRNLTYLKFCNTVLTRMKAWLQSVLIPPWHDT